MALAARLGVTLELTSNVDPLAELFCEELGAVIQIPTDGARVIAEVFADTPLAEHVYRIGRANTTRRISVRRGDEVLLDSALIDLHRDWSATTFHMQRLRDDPDCAQEEYDALCSDADPGLAIHLPEEPARFLAAPAVNTARPRIAILREQGVNGHVEMAAAFERAGFAAVDVHMTDLIEARASLLDFKGLAACGGFSYGDVLGAGSGWARSILYNDRLRDQFEAFFTNSDTFALGVCNGCQMLAQLKALVPGAADWPRFLRNRSDQFEARLVMTQVVESPSVLLDGMQGAWLPTVVAHGEGRAGFDDAASRSDARVALRYIDNNGAVAACYPANPNGSPDGITGLTTDDGRVTIMMPHPERTFLAKQYSWRPPDWPLAESPWLRLFHNARAWVG
jgi:phosphoribosylformylglycinamidine synthase